MTKKILFLLRAFNDIDHIAPVIWKAASSGLYPVFLFVDIDHTNDYRIQFIQRAGAVKLESKLILFYYNKFRRRLPRSYFTAIFDYLVEITFGVSFLKKHNIDIVVNEWSGPSGRVMARYFINAARKINLHVYSIPHGCPITINSDITRAMREQQKNQGVLASFHSRSLYLRYVVPNAIKKNFVESLGLQSDRVQILGSARFCRSWQQQNLDLIRDIWPEIPDTSHCKVVFFLPQWNYNVDQDGCLALLQTLAHVPTLKVIVKTSTRTLESFGEIQNQKLTESGVIEFAANDTPSPLIISWSDIVINFGSSIGYEAVLQNKPISNPRYLHSNITVFDESEVAYDAFTHEEVIQNIQQIVDQEEKKITDAMRDIFLKKHVYGGWPEGGTLTRYLELITQ